MSKTPQVIITKFNFAQIELTPYAGNGLGGSSNTCRKVFNKLMEFRSQGEVKIFDKNKTNDDEPRFIGVLQCVFDPKNDLLKGKMILLREKNPSLINDNYEFDHIKNLDNRKFVEVSHFCVNYKHTTPLLMFEKSQNGPRLSDFSYFLRHFGKNTKLAKYCNIVPLINSISGDIIQRITAIDFIDLKVTERKREALKSVNKSYYSSANLINNTTPYKTIRIQTTYDKDGNQKKPVEMAKDVLGSVIENPDNADDYEILQLSYELDN